MPIVHRPKTDKFNFTIVPNEIINSKELSSDAIVVAIWLASKRSDWNIVKEAIKKQFGFSYDRVQKVFKNLLEHKYLSVNSEKDDAERYQTRVYTFYVNPEMNPHPYVEEENKNSKTKKKDENEVAEDEKSVEKGKSASENQSTVTEDSIPEKPSPEISSTEEPVEEKSKLTSTDVLESTYPIFMTDQQQKESYANLVAILPEEFNDRDKSLLLEEFKKVDLLLAKQIVEEFIYQRDKIKKPVAWVRKMIENCSKKRFYPTPSNTGSRELEVAKQDREKRDQNKLINKATKIDQELKIKKQIEGFEHAGPGSAANLMKSGTF